jgi:glucosamine--fructose-6-phosphate aminotransferase (isomerizing)
VSIDCLKRLEYRGYDSAGIGILNMEIQVFKEVGYISNLQKHIPDISGHNAIAQTRWATHGKVTKKNAHPHLSDNKKIAIVHNGIIENFEQLKEELIEKGYHFESETDSEVFAHLIQEVYHGDIEQALFNAVQKIKGYYAIVVMCVDEPDILIGARKDSPLVIGIGDNENFVASDIPAFLKYTNRVIYLNDGEICKISNKSVELFDEHNKPIQRDEDLISWDISAAEKSGFPHFMLKEIFEQTETIHQVIRGRTSEIARTIMFQKSIEKLLSSAANNIQIVACGTSYYAGLVGKYIIEKLTGKPVSVHLSSEYRYYGSYDKDSLVIGVTQSGETLDTIAALKKARQYGCNTLVVTNVIGSSATRITHEHILTQSGPEIGVAATKTFTGQVLVFFLIAMKLGMLQHTIQADDIYHFIRSIKQLPSIIQNILDTSASIRDVAIHLSNKQSVFYIGRGINFPLALEGALKLKEISYIHAEGFAAGELKHGPFALLTEDTPVVAIVGNDETYEKIIANIGEIKARGSKIISIAEDGDNIIKKVSDVIIPYPSDIGILSCVPIIIILQLLSYHVADLKGCSIDKPRNLAKSVTVE